MRTNKQGQNIVEYAVLLTAIVAALLAMSLYMKRGIQGTIKGGADYFGDQFLNDNEDVGNSSTISTTDSTTRLRQQGNIFNTTISETARSSSVSITQTEEKND